ncbi:MAG: hypothetical protein Q9208_005298 [Pyrenodesmia sp. 3 TL-2023]
MHPAPSNIYTHDVDFAALALEDPDFNKHLKSNAQLDFSNPQAVQFNYILWLQDLLDTTSDDFRDGYDPGREVVGLDIGTGSSCIYPLFGCAQRPKWKFIATDIDDKNISYARQNILRNDLTSRIRPLHTKPEDPLIPLDMLGIESMDFTLTNPPFYPSPASLLASAAAKSRPPHSACTGAPIEMVTPGGETAFVSRIIAESVVLKERVRWYTTMLGKMSSVGVVVEELKAKGVANWAVKEFVQGGKTRRSQMSAGVGFAKGNVWSRAARRQQRKEEMEGNGDNEDSGDDGEEEWALGFKVQLLIGKEGKGTEVIVRWLLGRDSVLWESFCGMLKRQIVGW